MKSKAADVTFKSNEVILNQALQNCKDWLKVMTGVNVSAEAMKVVAEKALQSRSHSKAFVDIIGMTSKESDLFTAVKTLMDTVSAYSKLAKSSSIAQQVLEYVFTNVETYGGMEKLNQHLEGLVAGKDRLMLEFGVGLPGTVEKTVELTVMKKDKMSPYSVKRSELLTGVIDLMKEYVEDAGRKYKEAVEAILNLNRFVTLVNEYAGLKKPEDRDRVEQQLMQNPLWENFKDLVSFPEPGSSYDYSLDIKDPSVKASVLIRAAKVVKAVFEDASMMLVEVSDILDTLIMGLDEVVEVMSVPEEEYLGIADQGSGNFDYGMALAAMRRKALDMSSNVSTEEILKARQILEQAGIPEEIVFMLEIPEEAQEELKIAAMKTLIAEYVPMFEKAGNPDDIKASLLKDVQSVLKAEAFNKLKVLSAKQIYSEIVLTDRFISANLGTSIKRVASIKPLNVVAVDGGDDSGFDVGDGDGDELVDNPYRYQYMMLSRLKQDCDYYLGHGGRHPKHLWAKNEADHIAEMKRIYDIFPADMKPEWLSMEDIDQYAKKMGVQASKKNAMTGHGVAKLKKINVGTITSDSVYIDIDSDGLLSKKGMSIARDYGDFTEDQVKKSIQTKVGGRVDWDNTDLLEYLRYDKGGQKGVKAGMVSGNKTPVDSFKDEDGDTVYVLDVVFKDGSFMDKVEQVLNAGYGDFLFGELGLSDGITDKDRVEYLWGSDVQDHLKAFDFDEDTDMYVAASKMSLKEVEKVAAILREELDKAKALLKKENTTANETTVANLEEKLKRAADVIRNMKADKVDASKKVSAFDSYDDDGSLPDFSVEDVVSYAGKEYIVREIKDGKINGLVFGTEDDTSIFAPDSSTKVLRKLGSSRKVVSSDGSKSIAELEKEGYTGIDASLDISLFEYGLAWKEEGDFIKFIYGVVPGDGVYEEFGTSSFSKNTDPQSEFDWVDWDDVFSFTGDNKDTFFNESLSYIVFALYNYYGHENVFGSSYNNVFKLTASKKVKAGEYSKEKEKELRDLAKEAREKREAFKGDVSSKEYKDLNKDFDEKLHAYMKYSDQGKVEALKKVQSMDPSTERPLSQLGLEKFQKGKNWGLRDIESKEVWFEPTYSWIDDVYNGTTGMVKTKDSNGDSLAVEILNDSGDGEEFGKPLAFKKKAGENDTISKIVQVLTDSGSDLMSMRKDLEKIFPKKDIDFTYSPVAHYRIKDKQKTIIIVNKEYADGSEAVVGNYAIGYEGQI